MINKILKNNQLNIYEKMCMIVLTEYSLKLEAIDSKLLSRLMGCDEIYVKHALDSLKQKGFILKFEEEITPFDRKEKALLQKEPEARETMDEMAKKDIYEEQIEHQILYGEEAKSAEKFAFKKFESTKYSGDNLIDQCIALIDEPLSYKQAKIMLSIAKNNLEEIEKSYQLAKASQVSDTIGFLINDLQKPKGSNKIEAKRKVIEKNEEKQSPYVQNLEKRSSSQVDTSKILKLKKYQQYQDL